MYRDDIAFVGRGYRDRGFGLSVCILSVGYVGFSIGDLNWVCELKLWVLKNLVLELRL